MALKDGLTIPDNTGRDILYRYLPTSDDAVGITEMLHEAYASLAAQGMRYLASHQHPETTKVRLSKGETIVAVDAGTIVGIVTLSDADKTQGSAFYNLPDVASFGQFAVRPSHQGRGIASALMNLVEQRAAEKGIRQLALDTSENAAGLIEMYKARGYQFVEYIQWDVTNYRSMVFAKTLTRD